MCPLIYNESSKKQNEANLNDAIDNSPLEPLLMRNEKNEEKDHQRGTINTKCM